LCWIGTSSRSVDVAAAHASASRPTAPNALWSANNKGEFMLGNRRYYYPLTITDFAGRHLVACVTRSTKQATFAFTSLIVFDCAFQGLWVAARHSHRQWHP